MKKKKPVPEVKGSFNAKKNAFVNGMANSGALIDFAESNHKKVKAQGSHNYFKTA